jgi:hypothetical protein
MSPLAMKTSQILRDLLIRERNHHPSPRQWDALDWIAQHLAGMADGTGPQKFFLSSLDPGCGKTSCLVAFIRALLESPEHRDVGVVIFSNRLDDIYYLADPDSQDDAMAAAGLVHDCFGHDMVGAKLRAEFAAVRAGVRRFRTPHTVRRPLQLGVTAQGCVHRQGDRIRADGQTSDARHQALSGARAGDRTSGQNERELPFHVR